MNRVGNWNRSPIRKPLTPREFEVLSYAAIGLSSKAISEELGLSRRTIDLHRGSILAKLNASNIAEAVQIAMVDGLI